MKKTKKIVALALAAVMLVSATVAVTVAYLQSTDSVTNTFTVGSVEILLDEWDVDDDENKGDITPNTNPARDKANAYKLYPGKSYDKDPTVTVKGTEDAWLFVKVVNGLVKGSTNIEAASGTIMNDGQTAYATIAEQLAANGWTLVDGETDVFAYEEAVSPDDEIVVFENFMIDSAVENSTLAGYEGATIVVTAYAVQKEMFATAQAAWNATFGAPVNP